MDNRRKAMARKSIETLVNEKFFEGDIDGAMVYLLLANVPFGMMANIFYSAGRIMGARKETEECIFSEVIEDMEYKDRNTIRGLLNEASDRLEEIGFPLNY